MVCPVHCTVVYGAHCTVVHSAHCILMCLVHYTVVCCVHSIMVCVVHDTVVCCVNGIMVCVVHYTVVYDAHCILVSRVRALYCIVRCSLYCGVRRTLHCGVCRALCYGVRCALYCKVSRNVSFMSWCITYVRVMYLLCRDVLRMSWCITYVAMYHLCHDVLRRSWCIFYVVTYSFGVVIYFSIHDILLLPWCLLLRCITPVGWSHDARRLQHPSGVACILTTLCKCYPVYDALMIATCASVSCHIWRCRVWFICYIYVIHFHSLYVILLFAHNLPHLHTSSLAHYYCSLAPSLGRRAVGCRDIHYRRLHPSAWAVAAVSGNYYWMTCASSRNYVCSLFLTYDYLILAVFNNYPWSRVRRPEESQSSIPVNNRYGGAGYSKLRLCPWKENIFYNSYATRQDLEYCILAIDPEELIATISMCYSYVCSQHLNVLIVPYPWSFELIKIKAASHAK